MPALGGVTALACRTGEIAGFVRAAHGTGAPFATASAVTEIITNVGLNMPIPLFP